MISSIKTNYGMQNNKQQQASFGATHLKGYSAKKLQKAIESDLTGLVRTSSLKHVAEAYANVIETTLKGVINRFKESTTHDLTLSLMKPKGANSHNLTALFGLKGEKKMHSAPLSDLGDLVEKLRTFLPAKRS